ncbi:MAG: hypothetical protein IKL61_00035 [Clostridia bacterium]|nr:hypothetical protein [Clostridia bacterium]
MKVKHLKDNKERLSYFSSLYAKALIAKTKPFTLFRDQYEGKRRTEGINAVNARYCRNITFELIESEISSDVPAPSVKAKSENERDQENARKITNFLKNIRGNLPFEVLNDSDERNAYVFGTSFYLIEWDEKNNCVSLKVLSPENVVPQEDVKEIEDMDYIFLTFVDTREGIYQKFGKIIADDNAEIVVCYFKNDEDKVSQAVFTTDVLLAYTEDVYAKKSEVCKHCGEIKGLCKCGKEDYENRGVSSKEIFEDVLDDNGQILIPKYSPVYKNGEIQTEKVFDQKTGQMIEVPKMKRTVIPKYTFNNFPIIKRSNIPSDEFFAISDCEMLWPTQMELSKIETRIIEKILKAGVIPYSSETCDITFTDEIYTRGVKLKNAQERALLGVLDIGVNVSADVMEAERLYQQGKRLLGISDSFQGLSDQTAISGYAKEMLIQRSNARLLSKRIMKNCAYESLDKLIFKFYLAFYDYGRSSFMESLEEFCPYDYLLLTKEGEYAYYDDYIFTTDSSVDVLADPVNLWKEIKSNFTLGVYGDPNSVEAKVLFWKNMEKARYPMAKENGEVIKGG